MVFYSRTDGHKHANGNQSTYQRKKYPEQKDGIKKIPRHDINLDRDLEKL